MTAPPCYVKIDRIMPPTRARVALRHWNRIAASVLVMAAALSALPAAAEPFAVIGILQGTAVLVRQTNRLTLVEGAALAEGDIVEMPAGAFAQIEFEDGSLVELGEASRVMLKPKLQGTKAAPPRLYLLEGWVKAAPAPKTELTVLSPRFELGVEGGATVVRLDTKAYAVFAERGAVRLAQRDGARSTVTLKAGEFASLAAGVDKATIAPRMSGEFLQALPKMFRDALPPRAALFAKRNPTLKVLGPIEYADVKPWLQGEPMIRLPLVRQWVGRASDKAFRAELVANLNAHKEWERILFPERFLPKKPPPPPVPRPAEPASAASP